MGKRSRSNNGLGSIDIKDNNIQCICIICNTPSNLYKNHIVENYIICDKCMKNVPDYIPESQVKRYFDLKKHC